MEHQVSGKGIENDHINRSLLFSVLVYLITTFHHFYGAVVYDAPWRRGVATNGGIALIICVIFWELHRRYKIRVCYLIYSLVSFIFFGLIIGLFEGLYNHIIKDILFFSGMPYESWKNFFPPPAYEIPDNFIFESTGILQFLLSAILFYHLFKSIKKVRTYTFK